MTEKSPSRIWELDALRGVCILGVVLFHLLFDLQYFLGISLERHLIYDLVGQYGGTIFVVLSGLCATLGRRSFRRGVLVFGCAMGITAVTAGMAALGLSDWSVLISFGVLHLLGISMMLWPLFKKRPVWFLVSAGVPLVVLGYWFRTFCVEIPWLFPLGLRTENFFSSDYFPLLPHLGWFLLGAALGRTAYREKRTLLPDFPSDAAPVRFFCWCGRQSLFIYLLHQPVLYGLTLLLRGL